MFSQKNDVYLFYSNIPMGAKTTCEHALLCDNLNQTPESALTDAQEVSCAPAMSHMHVDGIWHCIRNELMVKVKALVTEFLTPQDPGLDELHREIAGMNAKKSLQSSFTVENSNLFLLMTLPPWLP